MAVCGKKKTVRKVTAMRIRLKFQRKTSSEKVFLFIAIVCIASFAVLENTSISIPIYSVVKNPLLYMGGICILTQLKTLLKAFMKKKYFYLWLLVMAFCTFIFIAAYNNKNPDIGSSPMRGTVRMTLFLSELMALMVWVSEKGYSRYLVNILFWYILILVALTDILLLTGIIQFRDGTHEAYLVGTKFNVSYIHLDLLMLWFIKGNAKTTIKNIPIPVLIISTVLLIIISVRVHCITGILGCIVLFACYMIIDRPSRRGLSILNSPIILIVALVVNLLFPFISKLLVSIPAVNWFVVDVLGKSENLTGRTEIFEIFGEQMNGHWLFGFGFGNENLAAKELFGYANAQNALLQWLLRAGLVNTVLLVCMMVQIFYQRSRSDGIKRTMPLAILIYVYIILGTIEVTFSMSFLLWLFLLIPLIYDTMEQQEEKKTERGKNKKVRIRLRK